MRNKLAVAVVAAVAAVPVLVPPAHAAEGPTCDLFKPPYDSACETVIRVWCMLTRDNPICHI